MSNELTINSDEAAEGYSKVKTYAPSDKSAKGRVFLLGCPIERLSLEQTIQRIGSIIRQSIPQQHCVVNAGKLVLMHRNPALKEIVHSCPLINADGQSVVWALRMLGRSIPERVTGIDLMERLLAESEKIGYKIFLLGARQETLDDLIPLLNKNYPRLTIAGSHHGYFSEKENDSIVEKIAASGSHILFVAMGSPKKEFWISKNLKKFNVPFCMGVGGSFDVIAGKIRRAPRWVQSMGMEWFFRFMQEPKRLWRRYWVDNFVFIYLVLAYALKQVPHLKRQRTSDLMEQEIT